MPYRKDEQKTEEKKRMGLFQKKIGCVFLKETSDAEAYIERLEALARSADEASRKKIQRQIKLAQYGLEGEKQVAYELKTSGMDMYVLHDICLEIGELSAQIDYIVVTRKLVYIIECKNLYGNIEIDHAGNFVRQIGPSASKEGIYSPITQNQRHMRVLKEIRKESKGNFLLRAAFEKNFEENYKSIVVLANPRTYLNAKYAKKEIKQQVIRADQLVSYIKEMNEQAQTSSMGEKAMLELANFYLERHVQGHSDYAKRYEEMVAMEKAASEPIRRDVPECGNTGGSREEKLVQRLKEFRLQQSRKENIKAYYIFNDAQMQELIAKNPQNKEELCTVAGFGKVKVEKYGDSILSILKGNER